MVAARARQAANSVHDRVVEFFGARLAKVVGQLCVYDEVFVFVVVVVVVMVMVVVVVAVWRLVE